jgi:hypothetical protein
VPRPSRPQPPQASQAARPLDPATAPGATCRRRGLRGLGHEVGDAKDLRPIGKARLRALREAIRNGTYPSNEFVEQGLFRMFTRPTSRPPRG